MTDEAKRVHGDATVVLAHVHMKRRYTASSIEYDRVDEDLADVQVDIPKLKRGGVNVIWLSEGSPGEFAVDAEAMSLGAIGPPALGAPDLFYGASEPQRMLRAWDAMYRLCEEQSDDIEVARTVREAREISSREKIAAFIHTEALLIANDPAMLRTYHRLGMRCSGLVHGAPSDWIDSDLEQREPGGLSELGREIVGEMDSLGIVIDVSHASEKAVFDVLEESRNPIVASHSNVRSISPIRRNLSDDQIKGVADSGGVIGIHCSSAFVDFACREGRRNTQGPQYGATRMEMIGKVRVPGAIDPFAYEVEMRDQYSPPTDAEPYFPTTHLERLIDHVDYLVNLVGIDHVGIGTDFQFLEDAVEGFDDVSKTPNVTAALLNRGYPEADVRKILGENFLRVMSDVIGE